MLQVLMLIAIMGCKRSDDIVYLGTYRGMDRLIPYPFLIKTQNDSISLIDNQGIVLDKIHKTEISTGDTLKFESKHLFIGKKKEEYFWIYDILDTLQFRFDKNGNPSPKSGAKFQKLKKATDLDIDQVKKTLTNNIWQYDVVKDDNSNPNYDLEISQSLFFKNDTVYLLKDYYYQGRKLISEYETKLYSVFKVGDMILLSYSATDRNSQPIFQIVNGSSEKIEIKDFSSRDSKILNLRRVKTSSEEFLATISKTRQYSNCYDGYQGEYYFGDDVTHRNGNAYIMKHISKELPNNESKSGYIIVHFTINCRDQVGNFGLIQMDKKFKKMKFSPMIVDHIMQKVSELDNWHSSQSALDWLYYEDVHAFLMFKINSGKIVDVCP